MTPFIIPRASTLLSVSMDLPVLDISNKWNHTNMVLIVCGLLYLAYFQKSSINCCFFYGWILSRYMDLSYFVYSCIHWWTFELLPLSGYFRMLLWITMYKFLCEHVFSSLWCMPKSSIADHTIILCLTFWGPGKLFFTPFTFPPAMYEGFNFSNTSYFMYINYYWHSRGLK